MDRGLFDFAGLRPNARPLAPEAGERAFDPEELGEPLFAED
jgi:hypothetical protein